MSRCYFDNVFAHPSETIDAICKTIYGNKLDDVDLLVGTGISGALPLIATSMRVNIPACIIRRENEQNNTHSSRTLEHQCMGETTIAQYVIIDDLIDSGTTVKSIITRMYKYRLTSRAMCRGIILYQDTDWHSDYRDRLIVDIGAPCFFVGAIA